MKLKILLESTPTVGAISTEIYNLVLKHLKTDRGTLDDIKDKMFSTDEFWTDEAHEVQRHFKSEDVEEAMNGIFNALDEIGGHIASHYDDRLNHAPGYKKPSISEFSSDSVSWDEVSAVVKKLAPEIFKRHEDRKAEKEKLAKANEAAAIKQVQKKLPELAEAVVKLYKKSWDDWYAFLKKNPEAGDSRNFMDDRGVDLKVIKSGTDLALHVRNGTWKNAESEWMNDTFTNILDAELLSDDLSSALGTAKRHKPTAKKLWAMIKDKV